MLYEVTEEKIKELASIYDDIDTFVSLYLDVTRDIDWKYIAHRESQCLSALKTNKIMYKAFLENMDELKPILKKDIKMDLARNKFRGVAVFISKPMNYFQAIGLPHTIKNQMVVDTSPYIRPLAQLIDEWENYALVLIDNNKAQLFAISLGAIKDQKRLATHIMNKHKKGGWSQMRFQRLRREAIDRFQKKEICVCLRMSVVNTSKFWSGKAA